jgi:cell division septation protein DedD
MTDPARPQNAPQAPRPSAATASPPTRTASIPPTVAPAVGGHVVQVASQRSEQDAQASFRALQAKYPSVLGGRDPLIRRIDLGERGIFFRVQVGPFASIDQANDLCTSLKAAGGQCIVQRN